MTGRWCVLGRPWFLGAVALLAVNDHVWKQDHPGLATGKLSDIAGVVVVAAIAAAVLGRTRGLAATALGFVLLKTVPGVAELAAPLLGGVTRRDPLDLIALVALVPLWWALGERSHRSPAGLEMASDEHVTPCAVAHSDQTRRSWLGSSEAPPPVGGPDPAGGPRVEIGPPGEQRRSPWRRVAGSALPIVGACTALVVTTATSCDPEPAVIRVVVVDDAAYAYVDAGFGGVTWARSNDSGRAWTESAAPPGVDPDAPAGIPTSTSSTTTSSTTLLVDTSASTTSSTTEPSAGGPYDDTALGPLEDCSATECFRLVDGRVIQRAPAGSEQWRDEFVLDDDEAEEIDTGCSGGTKGVLTSVAATDGPGGAVASLGAAGVVSRNDDGSWDRRPVLDADVGNEPNPLSSPTFWIVVALGPLGMTGAWLLGRPGTALRIVGVVASAMGVVLVIGGTITFGIVRENDAVFGRAQVILAGTFVVLGLGLSALSRSSARATPAPTLGRRPPPPSRPNPPAR